MSLVVSSRLKKRIKVAATCGHEIQSDYWEVVKDALSDELSSTGAAAIAASKNQPLFQLISGRYSSHGPDSKQTVGFVCLAFFFSSSPHRLISSHRQQIELSVSRRRGIQRLRLFGLCLCLFERQMKAVGRGKKNKTKENSRNRSANV